ncbi:MAG: hypothetical protein IPF56_11060 [Chloroflexi bacterium]|nr:hypothetical protein [Chloroflexota bacterium]
MTLKRLFLMLLLVVGTAVLAACGATTPQPEAVEVTRAVTEAEPPAAVGSESTAGDSPTAPDSGPKVAATRAPAGTAVALPAAEMEVAVEAAVPAADAARGGVAAPPCPWIKTAVSPPARWTTTRNGTTICSTCASTTARRC